MNIKLAKQLKDAGFPYDDKYGNKRTNCWYDLDNPNNSVEFPTLSELIFACGEGTFHITNNEYVKNSWYAQLSRGEKVWQTGVDSYTPEEAVAKLWLKLANRTMKEEKKIEYTIEEIESIADAWSWKNPQNRRDYPIIIDFLCEIDPRIQEGYKFDPYAKLSIPSFKKIKKE